MAITFIQQKKRQKYLFIVLVVLIAISLLVVWQLFFVKSKPAPVTSVVKKPEVKIDFNTLKNPIFDKLTIFQPIVPFNESMGRENPFIPYQ